MSRNDGLVAVTAALPRWARMTARNAELLAYLQMTRRSGAASTSPSPRIFTEIANKKEK